MIQLRLLYGYAESIGWFTWNLDDFAENLESSAESHG